MWEGWAHDEGSVQHLDFLDGRTKRVFKTAFELNQMWVVKHAADRTLFICQAQSLNLYLPAHVSKERLHEVHWAVWEKGCKSAYYWPLARREGAHCRHDAD